MLPRSPGPRSDGGFTGLTGLSGLSGGGSSSSSSSARAAAGPAGHAPSRSDAFTDGLAAVGRAGRAGSSRGQSSRQRAVGGSDGGRVGGDAASPAPIGERDKPLPERGKQMPSEVTAVLMRWLLEHLANPYPTAAEKEGLMRATGLDAMQLRNWLTNQRCVALLG
jgi:hypothetical protein